MWSPQGLGGDDRAGVYAIIQIIENGYRPSIVFTTDEELCCLGAQALIEKKPICPFKNLKAIIELDRQGKKDMVFYGCRNSSFKKYIKNYDFIFKKGSFSDISILAPAWDVAAVNLSIGYEDEHSPLEILHIDWLEETIKKVKNILNDSFSMPTFAYNSFKHLKK